MSPQPRALYEFGPFLYDAGQHLLTRQGAPVPVIPKALDLLEILLERHGRVVEKAELMRLLWPDTVVEEIGLARNVSTLRKALGDDAGESAYIETIPKRGYRFVAELRVPDEPALEPSPQPQPPPARPRPPLRVLALLAAVGVLAFLIHWQFYRPSRYLPATGAASLAVLPFETISTGAPEPAFSRALNEVLISHLLQNPGIVVTSPSTIRRYQALRIPTAVMSRVLGLDTILEGAVQQQDGNLRITARLADVHSGKLIWAASFDQPARNLPAAQSETARRIAAEVAAHLMIRQRVTAR